jgi:hypothetical protein
MMEWFQVVFLILPEPYYLYDYLLKINLIILIGIFLLSPFDIVLAMTENKIPKPAADDINHIT